MLSPAPSVTSGLSRVNSDGAEGGKWTSLPSPATWVTIPGPGLHFPCDIQMYHVYKPTGLPHGCCLHSLFPGFPAALLRQSHNTPPVLASGILAVKLKAKTSLPPAPHTFTAPHLPPLQCKPLPLGSPSRHLLFGPGDMLGLFYMFLNVFLDPHTLVSSVPLRHGRLLESLCHPSVPALCIQ